MMIKFILREKEGILFSIGANCKRIFDANNSLMNIVSIAFSVVIHVLSIYKPPLQYMGITPDSDFILTLM